MLLSSRDDERLIGKHAMELQMGSLKYIGTHGLHERFPTLWESVAPDADLVLQSMWGDSGQSELGRRQFVTGNRMALNTTIPWEVLQRVEEAIGKKRGGIRRPSAGHVHWYSCQIVRIARPTIELPRFH